MGSFSAETSAPNECPIRTNEYPGRLSARYRTRSASNQSDMAPKYPTTGRACPDSGSQEGAAPKCPGSPAFGSINTLPSGEHFSYSFLEEASTKSASFTSLRSSPALAGDTLENCPKSSSTSNTTGQPAFLRRLASGCHVGNETNSTGSRSRRAEADRNADSSLSRSAPDSLSPYMPRGAQSSSRP